MSSPFAPAGWQKLWSAIYWFFYLRIQYGQSQYASESAKLSCQNLVQNYKSKQWHNCDFLSESCCMLEFSKKKQANMLGWILTIRCMLYCQFLGEKIPIFYLGSKIFHSKNLLLASYRDCCCLISFFCHLSSILCPLIELMSLCKQQNKLDVCIFTS